MTEKSRRGWRIGEGGKTGRDHRSLAVVSRSLHFALRTMMLARNEPILRMRVCMDMGVCILSGMA